MKNQNEKLKGINNMKYILFFMIIFTTLNCNFCFKHQPKLLSIIDERVENHICNLLKETKANKIKWEREATFSFYTYHYNSNDLLNIHADYADLSLWNNISDRREWYTYKTKCAKEIYEYLENTKNLLLEKFLDEN
jgi:hypothetical protein